MTEVAQATTEDRLVDTRTAELMKLPPADVARHAAELQHVVMAKIRQERDDLAADVEQLKARLDGIKSPFDGFENELLHLSDLFAEIKDRESRLLSAAADITEVTHLIIRTNIFAELAARAGLRAEVKES